MSDVFVSYARTTTKQARQMTEALKSLGYSVWIDDELPAHRNYSHVIEEQLNQAKAVLVLWSAEAARSDWVMDEAERGREQRKLVQVSLDKTRLPMPFGRIQCADLAGWSGDLDATGWHKVVAGIANLAGASATPALASAAEAAPAAEPTEPLLAVLAFDNLSDDPEMAYFSDGVSEEILQTVANGANLKVIGRGSSFHFRGPDKAAAHIATALNATHVLDGSVRRSGSRVRISANLIECVGETTLWSGRFDRELSDVFALQDEIAAAVADALKVAFTPAREPMSIDPAAYEFYLRAMAQTGNLHVPATHDAIIDLLEQATHLAPGFARAWSSLATVRARRFRMDTPERPVTATRAKAIEAAEMALRLDPNSGEAFQALSQLEPPGCYEQRETFHRRALYVAPNDPAVLYLASNFSAEVGRIHEALSFAKRQLELDPVGPVVFYPYLLDVAGDVQASRAFWHNALSLWPESGDIVWNAIASAAAHADWAWFDELVAATRTRGHFIDVTRDVVWLGRNQRDPDRHSIDRALGHAQADLDRTGSLPLSTLTSLSALGMTDEVFGLIDQASFLYILDPEQRPPAGAAHPSVIFSIVHNSNMMRDPRFPRLCAKLRLCGYWVESNRWPDCAEDGLLPYDFKAECRQLLAA